MLIPQYWAESRKRHRTRNRQITVRRFGWSETSQDEAQAMAERRVRDAIERIVAGDSLPRREPKVPYGGASGLPIREEVIERIGPDVITRNSYGALCLNTPDVLFVDIDFATGAPGRLYFFYFLMTIGLPAIVSLAYRPLPELIAAGVVLTMLGGLICSAAYAILVRLRGGHEAVALRRIEKFVEARPDWHLRTYRTPGGFRLLAMHRTFEPGEPEVAECFKALGADRQYARMCLAQKCFRARVSPKPWRIGLTTHIRPGRGGWPVAPERQAQRQAWVDEYAKRAAGFAACRFVGASGSMMTTARTTTVARLHDEMARATRELPIA